MYLDFFYATGRGVSKDLSLLFETSSYTIAKPSHLKFLILKTQNPKTFYHTFDPTTTETFKYYYNKCNNNKSYEVINYG